MLIATAEAGASERAAPTAVAPDLRAALHRVAERFRLAADAAESSARGSSPEWGAQLVVGALDSMADDLAALRIAAADPDPAPE